MKTYTELKISREELYRRIWERPMRDVAAELGISDVGLKKTCRREGIPTPPQGYHLMADGTPKKRLQAPLPAATDRQSAELTFRVPDQAVALAERQAIARVREMSAREPNSLTTEQRRAIDSTLKELRAKLDVHKTDRHGMVDTPQRGYPLRVSPQSFERAFQLLNSIFTRLAAIGGAQFTSISEHGAHIAGFQLDGFGFHVSIEEKNKRVEVPPPPQPKRPQWNRPTVQMQIWNRFEYRPTGMLTLSAWGPASGSGMKVIRDGARVIEDCLDSLVEWAISQAEVAKEESRIASNRWQRAVAYLQDKDKPRLEAEFQRRRRRELHKEALQWRQATALRQYVAAVEEAGPNTSPLGMASPEGFQEWLVWAKAYANSLDPISRSEAASIPPYPEPEAYEKIPRIFLDYDDPAEADRVLQKEPWRRY